MINTAKELDNKQSINNFLRLMSHEMRTPLNSIMGGVGLFSERYKKQDVECMQFIDYGVNRLLHLVKVLSDIVYINSDEFILFSTTVELKSFINKLELELSKFSKVIDKAKVTIHYSYENSENITIDEDIVFKILYVLCSNIVYSCNKPQIVITFLSQENDTTIRVEETGNGIPSSKISFINNPSIGLKSANDEKCLCENNILDHIMMNELLLRINSKIEVISENSTRVVFQFCIPTYLGGQ